MNETEIIKDANRGSTQKCKRSKYKKKAVSWQPSEQINSRERDRKLCEM